MMTGATIDPRAVHHHSKAFTRLACLCVPSVFPRRLAAVRERPAAVREQVNRIIRHLVSTEQASATRGPITALPIGRGLVHPQFAHQAFSQLAPRPVYPLNPLARQTSENHTNLDPLSRPCGCQLTVSSHLQMRHG